MRSAILGLLALVAATVPAAAKRAPVPPALPADLAAYGEHGVQVGATILFDKPVDAAAYDASQDLIWLSSQRQLFVIDLRDAHPTAVAIAKDLPEDVHTFRITGWSTAGDPGWTAVYPSFALGAKTAAFSAATGVSLGIDADGDRKVKKAIKKIKIVGAAWIAAQHARKASPPAMRPAPPKVTLPAGQGTCSEPGACGTTAWLGDSPYQTVLVMQDCNGPACENMCALYDPAAKKFAPAGAGTWGALAEDTATMSCEAASGERGGAHYFGPSGDNGNQVCTLGAGRMTCVDAAPWVPFAWVKK